MPLESGSFLNDLVITNPVGTDSESQGDDHLRLIKTVLKATFPNMGGAAFRVQAKSVSPYNVVLTDNTSLLNCTAAVTVNLLAAATAGNGFFLAVYGNGFAQTLDPAGAELINGAATLTVPSGYIALVWCDGTAYHALMTPVVSSGVYQPLDATLTALAAANWALDALPIGTGVDTLSQVAFAANTFPAKASTGALVAKPITDFGLSLVDDADAATARTTLGLVAGGAGDIWVEKAGDTMVGALSVIAGTAALPGLAIAGDLNTGVYSPSADTLGFSTGGQLAVLLNNGVVALHNNASTRIGYLSSTLAAIGAGSNTDLFIVSDTLLRIGTGGANERISISATGNIAFDTNTLYVDAANNRVGVGTATPAYLLDGIISVAATTGIQDVASFSATSTGTTDSAFGARLLLRVENPNGNVWPAGIAALNSAAGSNFSDLAFYTGTAGPTLNERARITSGGVLLVGTMTAGPTRLGVQGSGTYNSTGWGTQSDVAIRSSEMSNDAYNSILQLVAIRQSLTVGNASNGYLGFSTIDDSNADGVNDAARIAVVNESGAALLSPTALSFWTNAGGGGIGGVAATEKMRITSGGNVLIGSTGDLGQPLRVAAAFAKTDTTERALLLFGSNDVGSPSGLRAAMVGHATTQASRQIRLQTTEHGVADAGSLALQYAAGNVLIGTTTDAARLTVDSGAAGLNALFNSTHANGPYQQWNRSSVAIGDIGAGGQIVSGGGADNFGINVRGANTLILGVNSIDVGRLSSAGLQLNTAAGTNALYSESGIDRSSASAETFNIQNSGAGTMTLQQDGVPVAVTAGVQVFTSNGTWTKPAGAKAVRVILVGGGGGGGSGRRGAAGTARGGGGGGAGGGCSDVMFDASIFGATVSVTVGAGGNGGTAVTTDDTSGVNGGTGGDSVFGSVLRAGGGGFGSAGTGTTASGGTVTSFGSAGNGTSGANGSATAAGSSGSAPVGTNRGGGGGGGGGSVTSANVENNGGFGAAGPSARATQLAAGTFGVANATRDGGAGASAPANEPFGTAGGGGGAGEGDGVTAGGNGGAGGNPGGGGGGGGASTNGANSGAGGTGGPGLAIIITYF